MIMLALLDNNQDLDECADELGCGVGQLLTPLTRYTLRHPDKPWAIDNGAYANFDADAFRALLDRENHHRQNCLFVTAPDVVGSGLRARNAELLSLADEMATALEKCAGDGFTKYRAVIAKVKGNE